MNDATATPDTGGAWNRLLAAVVATTGPIVFAHAVVNTQRTALIAVVLLVASVGSERVDADRWAIRLGVWIAGGTIAGVIGMSEMFGAWCISMLILADWAIRRRSPIPLLPRGGDATVGVTVIVIVTAVRTYRDPAGWDHLVLTGVAYVLTLTAAALGDRLSRATRAVAHAVGHVASVVVFGLLGIVVVVIPWLAHRLFRLDPVAVNSSKGWMARPNRGVEPTRPWSDTTTFSRTPLVQRIRWRIAVPILLVVPSVLTLGAFDHGPLGGLIGGDPGGDRPQMGREAPFPAIGNVDWWWDYKDEIDWAFGPSAGSRNPGEGPPLFDISGRYINVVDGHRVSWRPPECDCRRLRVWIYGGSAALGWGQRDDYTPPSQLARVAWSNGLALDVSNRGIAGELNWQESQRLAWDLTAEPPPDLVIFYDGYNDLRAAYDRNADRAVGYDPDWPIHWNNTQTHGELDELRRNRLDDVPEGSKSVSEPVPPELNAVELGTRVVASYERGRRQAVSLAETTGVPTIWLWQPDRFTKPHVEGEPESEPEDDRFQRLQRTAAESLLADDVVNITNAFDDVADPLFFDDAHTSERGAGIVAEHIYSVISPTLHALLADAHQ